MTPPPDRPFAQELLAQAGWVRELAGRLVEDQARADDVAQETLLAAWSSPPSDSSGLKGWLATVAQNVARRLGRGERRRRDREQHVAEDRPKVQVDDELGERALRVRGLVDDVLALERIHRDILLLRYFEGLSTRECATRLGLPHDTARTRLTRAHARLRARLTERHGDAATWCSLLLPLGWAPTFGAGVGGATAAATSQGLKSALGTLVMKIQLQYTLPAIAALIALGLHFGRPQLGSPPGPVQPATDPSTGLEAPAPLESLSNPSGTGRVGQASVPTTTPGVTAPLDPGPWVLLGRIVDLEGNGVEGLHVLWSENAVPTPEEVHDALGASPKNPVSVTDGKGHFELHSEEVRNHVSLAESDWILLGPISPQGSAEDSGRQGYMALESIRVAGVVTTDKGTPIEGARVSSQLSAPSIPGFMGSTTGIPMINTTSSSTTDLAGRYVLDRVPRLPNARIYTMCTGFEQTSSPPPQHATENFDLVLDPIEEAPGQRVDGIVVDRNGSPVPGATVTLGTWGTHSDAKGEFAFELPARSYLLGERRSDAQVERIAIAAWHPEHGPAVQLGYGLELRKLDGAEAHVVLTLGEPGLALTGRLVDDEGRGLAAWNLTLLDPTYFNEDTDSVESVAAGMPGSYSVQSDGDGSFRLPGLLDRTYRIVAWHPGSLESIESEPIRPGGPPIRLSLPGGRRPEDISGVLLDRSGAPIPGIELSLAFPLSPGAVRMGWTQEHVATTDDFGGFTIRGMGHRGCQLRISGGTAVKTDFDLDELARLGSLQELELTIPQRARLLVEGAGSLGADGAEIVDRAGDPMRITITRTGVTLFVRRATLEGDVSEALEVSDFAEELVLFAGDVELQRIPIRLEPGTVTTLRP